MDKSVYAGSGIAIIGIACPVINNSIPLWVGWAGLLIGVAVIAFPHVAHRFAGDYEPHGPNDLGDTAPPPAPPPIVRGDTWLQDAVAFALYGHWPVEDETVFGEDGDIEKMGNVIEQMRGFAHAGALRIWGRQNQLSLHVPIEPDFWVNNVIALDTLWGPPETPRTEPLDFGAPPPFKALKVCKAQMEELWPH